MNTDSLADAIEKLHLEPGDILVVHDPDLLQPIIDLHLPLSFPVPILCVEDRLEKTTRKKLMELLARLPEEETDA